MSVAFWATKIVAGKPVEVQPPEGFVLNLQQAAIVNGKDNQSYTVNVETLAIEGDKLESVIGTLRPGKVDQFNFNLVFGYDVPTKFSITTGDKDGKAVVHLSGYFQPAPEEDGDDEEMDYDDFDEEDGEDDDEEDDEEEPRVVELDANDKPKKNEVAKKVEAKNESKQPAAANKKPAAQPKKPVVEESDDDEDEDDEDEEAHIEKLKGNGSLKKHFFEALLKKGGDDDEDSEEEEDSEDDEDDEEDLPPLKVQKTAPQGFAPGSAKKNDNKSAPSSAQKTNNNNNQNKTPQANKNQGQNKGPQSANKPNNNNNQQNKSPQQNKNNNNNHNGNNKGNKFQSGDKRKR